MYIKNLKFYNSKLLRQMTWANRADRFFNGLSLKIYRHFLPETLENSFCLETLEITSLLIEIEKQKLKDVREILSENPESSFANHQLTQMRKIHELRHDLLETRFEKVKQYRKEL